MSSDPVISHAVRLLQQISPENPADYVLRGALGSQSQLEAATKKAVARAVFGYYRWLGWLDDSASLARRLEVARDLQARFDADPASIKDETLAARAVPSWLAAELDLAPAYLRQLQRDPALWIRTQREFTESVPRALRNCQPPALAGGPASSADLSTAFRYIGAKDLYRTDEFRQGLFEIQDLASQLVGHACAPQPGHTWWDTCAGEGGKTLHLADLMDNKGLIWATDRHTGRLATLRKRAARAKVFNYRAVTWNGGPFLPTKTKFDGILIDAPCSGVGTWQRNPHARWTTSPDDVRELADIQRQLLGHACAALKPGGRLVYAVCTLTRSETTAVADGFTAAHADFAPAPAFPGDPASPAQLHLWPQDLDANGMFIAAWRKK